MLAEKLAAGIAEMGLPIATDRQAALLDYLALLQKWNKVYNLTAVRDPLEMVALHLLDSLSILPFLNGEKLLDVGSGAGLPGVIMAICLPELQVTTIDAVQKKAIFMRQVKGELSLNNLEVVHGRVEDFQPATPYDMIVSRAFSEISMFIKLSQHLLNNGCQWLAMKGVMPERELNELEGMHTTVYPLNVAGLNASRHLVVIERDAGK